MGCCRCDAYHLKVYGLEDHINLVQASHSALFAPAKPYLRC